MKRYIVFAFPIGETAGASSVRGAFETPEEALAEAARLDREYGYLSASVLDAEALEEVWLLTPADRDVRP